MTAAKPKQKPEEMAVGSWAALHRAIIEVLPDEGSRRGKYLLDGRTSADIHRALDDSELTTAAIGRRLAELKKTGLVVDAAGGMRQPSKVWQRTELGKKILLNGKGDGA